MIFPSLPAFLDSSNWNHQQQAHQLAVDPCVGGGNGSSGNSHELATSVAAPSPGTGAPVGPTKPMSMADRARLARVPQPEPGLKCPRCESTNTKFCYFNNYSLSQPRHFCRACRRYWTRGGALRNVPVGGGYRRHAKRAKAKPPPNGAAATTPASSNCTMTPSSIPVLGNSNAPILPPLQRFSDFDAANLGTMDVYSIGSGGGGGTGLEQWRVQQQMQNFPFLQGMEAMPPPAMSSAAMSGMFHLGLEGGGAGEDGGELHMMAMKKEGYYPRGVWSGGGGGGDLTGFSSYSSTGNLL